MDLDLLMRYAPLIEHLETHAPRDARILEVGSGSHGITRFCKRRVVGLDIDFPPPVSPYLEPHKGHATAIPFPDHSFDFVVCTDVLEHIPGDARELAMREMWRLARRAVLCGVPCGSKALRYEERYNTAYRQRLGRDNPWLVEHQQHGLPEAEEVRRAWLRVTQGSPEARIHESGNVNLDFWLETHLAELMEPWPASYRKLRENALRNLAAFTKAKSFGDCYRRIFLIIRQE
ncbi:hypothetical protein SY88_22395 [Clostridiales bacterium PH28_bin88]|nr:hypothetical protein SY88_22395 [Clostridiales bacterium PH28_bin88]